MDRNAWERAMEKARSGERLDSNDGLALLSTPPERILQLGRAADEAKARLHGNRGYFVVNRQINPTNICVLSCAFCDFASKRGRPDAYELGVEEILAMCSDELGEVHITGGMHPQWRLEDYLKIVREIKAAFPAVRVKAFTAVEVDWYGRVERKPVEWVLEKCREAGVEALAGGGAEVFSERVRRKLFPFKIGARRWLEIHRIAHRMGLRSNSTLLYGHMETLPERVEHLRLLRELQDETGGFMSFIALAYQPGRARLAQRPASALDDLRTIAAARLFLDNFEHIKAYWVTLGEATAGIALRFGADDIDGTIGQERIMHASGATSPAGMTRERLISLLREAGLVPVERDGMYEVRKIYGDAEAAHLS